MEGWKHDKVKNQIQYKSGYTWSKEQELRQHEPGSVRVLTVTNIQEQLDLEEELYLKDVSEKDKKEKAVSKDWCIAVSSNGNRKRIGNCVFIKDDTDYLFASFLTAFKPKEDSEIMPEYFYRWLSSYPVQERLSAVSEGTTGLGNLSIRFLRNLDIHYPPKTAQITIVNILSRVDEAIEAVQGSITATDRLKKSLMQNLLTGKMKPDGTFRTPDEFYTDEKIGQVPNGWKSGRFKEFAILQRGCDLTDNEVMPGRFPVVKSNGVTIRHNQFFVHPPGVVTGRSGTIGKAFYIEEKFWAHNTTLYVKDFKGNVPKYIYYLILSMDFNRYYAGTTVPTLNRNDIHKLRVAIPKSYDEQQQIVSLLDAMINKIQQKQQKIAILERLKKSLMQNLLTGRVRVKEKSNIKN